MTTLESNIEKITASDTEIFAFLSNLNNFEKLVPEQVENWKSDTDTCSFRVSGMADIALKIIEKVASSKIVISSDGSSPVSFTMVLHITKEDDMNSLFKIKFLAELNGFMATMVSKPLGQFVNVLAEKLRLYYEK